MILGIIEHNLGEVNKQSLEMISFARKLGDVEAVIVGEKGRSIAQDLGTYGVKNVHLILHKELDDYAPQAWGKSIATLVGTLNPNVILAAGSDRGNELMAHMGALMNLPMASNCVEVKLEINSCIVTRHRWGGSLLEKAELKGEPKLITTYPDTGIIENDTTHQVNIIEHVADLVPEDSLVKIIDRVAPESNKLMLTDARVVVGGGRGVGSSEGFSSLEELAELLGGAVGCSRVVTNKGWRPHSDQIGQTGARIAPDLYIACGISGATQHWIGCNNSKNILVINTDPDATIVAKADHAVIADLHDIIPAINEELKKINSNE